MHILSHIIVICFSVKIGLLASDLARIPAAKLLLPLEDDEDVPDDPAISSPVAALTAVASSIIGSGLPGGEDLCCGRGGEDCGDEEDDAAAGTNCFLRLSRLSSSLSPLAILAGDRGISLKAEGAKEDAPPEEEEEGVARDRESSRDSSRLERKDKSVSDRSIDRPVKKILTQFVFSCASHPWFLPE